MSHRLQTQSDVGAAEEKAAPYWEHTHNPELAGALPGQSFAHKSGSWHQPDWPFPQHRLYEKKGPGHKPEGILAEEGVTSSKQSWWQHLPLDQKMQEAGGMQEQQG